MSRKWVFLGSSIIFLSVMVVLWIFTTPPANAQCGEPQPSSCTTCHTQEDPVSGNGEWHIIHASKDICINCHGGNATTMNKDLAHERLVANPLSDIYTDCHSCHPEDYAKRTKGFAIALGVTPGSAPTPTAVAAAPIESHPIVILPPASVANSPFHRQVAILGAGIPVLFLMGFILQVCLKIKGG